MYVEWKGPIVKASNGSGTFEWPKKRGVYVIANNSNGTVTARYVGQGNLSQRIQDHKNSEDDCVKKALDENRKIYYVLESDEAKRSNIEHTLYHEYGGREKLCNKEEPRGRMIDTNLPKF